MRVSRRVTVWLPRQDLAEVSTKITRALPNEAGGMLFGYWSDHRTCVIAKLTNSGPHAVHAPTSFSPDYSHDERVAGQIWEASQGLLNYLGDWHSHPNSTRPYLSLQDRRALEKITLATRLNDRPGLSMVFAATGRQIDYSVWLGLGVRFLGFRMPAAFKCRTILFDHHRNRTISGSARSRKTPLDVQRTLRY